jgi:hypothetical protein
MGNEVMGRQLLPIPDVRHVGLTALHSQRPIHHPRPAARAPGSS